LFPGGEFRGKRGAFGGEVGTELRVESRESRDGGCCGGELACKAGVVDFAGAETLKQRGLTRAGGKPNKPAGGHGGDKGGQKGVHGESVRDGAVASKAETAIPLVTLSTENKA